MKDKCAKAVRAAAKEMGRSAPTASELKAIDDRLLKTMRRLANADNELDRRAWRSLSYEQRHLAASVQIMNEIKAEAQKEAGRKITQLVVQARANAEVQGLKDAAGITESVAVGRHFIQTDLYRQELAKTAQGELMNTIKAAGDKTGASMGRRFLMALFDVDNPVMTRDMVREIFKGADGHTGNRAAKAGARAWLNTVEGLRMRFNAAGGDIRELIYGYIPQPHDRARLRKIGADAWAQTVLPLLNRGRYLDERGAALSDDAMLAFLREAHATIVTDGLNTMQPGEFKGTGKRANAGSEAREIHFADGDAWASYMQQFGRGSMYDAMMFHISGITRDIALVERYGPGATQTADMLMQSGLKANQGVGVGKLHVEPQTYWNMISGKTGAPADESLANAFQTVRNVMTAAKLGGALISSFADLGTLAVTAGYNRLPYWQLMKDIAQQGTAESREFMSVHGMAADSAMNALNRWSGENIGNNWSGHMANTVMRLSLLNAWTDGLKQGFTMSMNAKMADLTRKPWAELHEFDRVRFQRSGITEADWAVLNTVQPEEFKGRQLLTPQGIKQAGHRGLAERLMGLINDEADYAIISPNMTTRAIITGGGLQAGTYGGELARTVTQFKAFPISMFTRHWARMLEGDMGADGAPMLANRVMYSFAMMATLLGLGAVSTQTKQVLQGKDPINMDLTTGMGWRFLAKAGLTGGGLGIAGDLLFVDPQGGAGDAVGTAAKNFMGPAFGSSVELLSKVAIENIWQAAEGKETHWQAELLNWLKSNTPGAFLWWVKPFIEHGFLNAINENLSPGYLSRVQARARKDWGQQYWWAPRDLEPQRAPDFEKALGG